MDVRILIVDNHPTVRESLRFVFAAAGIRRVLEATNYNEAIDVVQKGRIDVVLLDVVLDEENGLDALRKIQAIDAALPVLIHSYHDHRGLLSRSFHVGAAGYLVKGLDKNDLIHAVRQAAAGNSVWTTEQMSQVYQADAESADFGQGLPYESNVPEDTSRWRNHS